MIQTQTVPKEATIRLKQAKDSAEIADPKRYVYVEPETGLRASDHFSSLLFSGSVFLTSLDFLILSALTAAVILLPGETVDTPGSMPLSELVTLLWCASLLRRFYNSYLEAVWFSCPQFRTQPAREHLLKKKKDLCGRDLQNLKTLETHDCVTMLTQYALEIALYYAVAGFHPMAPAEGAETQGWLERVVRLFLNHYVLSFGMYWMHRTLHTNKWAWDNIHSFHHWARHPLSRNTYEDHWLDNFMNAIIGHVTAQLLVPLDNRMFWFSRLFRICESLEKHSGVSCHWNLAHTAQRWLPFAQMPHHHDWHHEGHKGTNFTFTAMGGLWDCVFATRHAGRSLKQENVKPWATAYDLKHN